MHFQRKPTLFSIILMTIMSVKASMRRRRRVAAPKAGTLNELQAMRKSSQLVAATMRYDLRYDALSSISHRQAWPSGCWGLATHQRATLSMTSLCSEPHRWLSLSLHHPQDKAGWCTCVAVQGYPLARIRALLQS